MRTRSGPEHQCRQDRRCKARVRDDAGEFHGAGVERPDTLCRACETNAFNAIRELAGDYRELAGARTEERSRISGPKVSGSSERSIPIPLAVDTLMEEIDSETLRWTLRITRGDPLPATPQPRVHACLTVICTNLGTLVDLPLQIVTAFFPHPDGGDYDGRLELDGVDAVLRLAALHHRAEKILGAEEPKTNWLRETCHVCGRATLASDLSTATITCKTCRNVWDQDEFARLNNPLAAA